MLKTKNQRIATVMGVIIGFLLGVEIEGIGFGPTVCLTLVEILTFLAGVFLAKWVKKGEDEGMPDNVTRFDRSQSGRNAP